MSIPATMTAAELREELSRRPPKTRRRPTQRRDNTSSQPAEGKALRAPYLLRLQTTGDEAAAEVTTGAQAVAAGLRAAAARVERGEAARMLVAILETPGTT